MASRNSTKNGSVAEVEIEATEQPVTEAAEQVVTDLQAAGEARFNEIREAVVTHVATIDEALASITTLVRPIRDESLWVFGRNSTGEGYTGWKEAVKDMLNGAFSHWSSRAKGAIVVQLIDAGFTVEDAAEVTEQKPSEAKKAVTEADDQAQGNDTEPQVPTPPVELTAEQKANKIANQSLAQNKRLLDVLFDLSVADLSKLVIDHEEVVTQLKGMLAHKEAAETSGTSAA